VRRCKFCRELLLSGFGPLSVNELEEIKPDPDAVDPDQIRYALDMIDVPVECALFFFRAHEDGVNAHNAAPFTDHPDLFVTDVALDIVVSTDIRVRYDRLLGCDRENLFKTSWVDVRKINNHAEGFALTHDLATKWCQSIRRRAARGENSAVARRIGSGVRESDHAHTEFIKHAQLI